MPLQGRSSTLQRGEARRGDYASGICVEEHQHVMKWKRNTGFGRIEDRRGQEGGVDLGGVLGGGGGGGGRGIPIPIPGGKAGGGIGSIIVIIVLFLLFSGVL